MEKEQAKLYKDKNGWIAIGPMRLDKEFGHRLITITHTKVMYGHCSACHTHLVQGSLGRATERTF